MATSTLQIFSQSLDRHLVKARNIINVIVIIVFSLMVLVVFAQVVWRFLFNNPFPWSEELARYLQVWLILLASVACLRKGNHLAVDLFSQVSSFPIARGLKVVSIACILLFTAILFFASLHLIGTTFNEITPAIQLPIMVVYLAFPISAIFMFIESFLLLLRTLDAKDKKDLSSTEDPGLT